MLSDKFTEITKQSGLYNIQAISNISSIMEKGKSYMLCDAIHNLAMLSLISISHTGLLIDTLDI